MPQVQKAGLGHQPLLPSGARGAHRPPGGPAFSEGPAPGRTGPLGARSRGPARRSGGAVLLARSGPPCLPGPPGLGPPGVSPVHGPPKGRWEHAPPRPWGVTAPGPRNAPSLTSWLRGGGVR